MFTVEEDRAIKIQFDVLLSACERIYKREGDKELIISAFELANNSHIGVRRKSGEPYILHPLAVAMIVVDEIGLGVKSVCASLLHDVVEDTDTPLEYIEEVFGAKIASMVDGLTKIKRAGDIASVNSEQAENFKKILYTLSSDVRVMIIKLADRLHNMRTLSSMPSHKQTKIVSETIALFAPLAHRLGLYSIKSELEDLCFKYSFPKDYLAITERLNESSVTRNEYIGKFNAPIIEKLNESDVEFDIVGRSKSPYSIWKKMQRKQITYDEIFDLIAIRIVFKSVPFVPEKVQCWHIYSMLTDIYKPKPDRLRDWVNIPKANGYEALHCTVMGPDGVWVEVQIRSERMDAIAEKGFAAHWKYKDKNGGTGDADRELDKWIKEVREVLSNSTEDAVEFLDEFKLNLFASEVVVFTPKGDTHNFAKGATALDFAYGIHTNVGNNAIGAKINHKIVSIFTKLQSGDQVEILTSQGAHPLPEWLDNVATIKAKRTIKDYLKRSSAHNVERGQQIFNQKMEELRITPSARVFRKILPEYKCTNKEVFYSELGAGIINLDNLHKVLKENAAQKLIKYWGLRAGNVRKQKGNNTKEETNMNDFNIAKCCHPIPGDEIVGFNESGKITIHKKNCPNAIDIAIKHGNKIVKTEWASEKMVSYLTHIKIRGIDRIGILLELTGVITAQLNINIRKLFIESHDGIFEGFVSLYVQDIKGLSQLIKKVQKIKGIETVIRVDGVDYKL